METEPILTTKQEEKKNINPAPMLQIKPETMEVGEDSSLSSTYIPKRQKLQEEYPKLRCFNCIGGWMEFKRNINSQKLFRLFSGRGLWKMCNLRSERWQEIVH